MSAKSVYSESSTELALHWGIYSWFWVFSSGAKLKNCSSIRPLLYFSRSGVNKLLGQIHPQFIFVNKVLLEYGQAIHLCSVYGRFTIATVGLSWVRGHMVYKSWNIYYLDLNRKGLMLLQMKDISYFSLFFSSSIWIRPPPSSHLSFLATSSTFWGGRNSIPCVVSNAWAQLWTTQYSAFCFIFSNPDNALLYSQHRTLNQWYEG